MKNLHDLIIIGAGPSGCSAGIYAGRSRLRALLLDPSDDAGQISITNQVVNYPGIPETSGEELMRNMRAQAESFGVPCQKEKVRSIQKNGELFTVVTDRDEYTAVAVMAATGARPRAAGFEGEDTFRGRGVGYCATCDGEFFSGLDIFVVGGGFAAAEEAIFLTRYARKVHMIVMLPEFTCSQAISEEVLGNPDIEVHFSTRLVKLEGEQTPSAAVFQNDATGETWRYEPPAGEGFGVFVFAGYEPVTDYLKDMVQLGEGGYIETDNTLMTSLPGLFAAGDLRPKELRQLVTAVSDGAVASTNAEKYIAEVKKTHNIRVPGPYTASQKETEDDIAAAAVQAQETSDGVIPAEVRAQLQVVLDRMQDPVRIAVVLSPDNNSLNAEASTYAEEFASLSDLLQADIFTSGQNPTLEAKLDTSMLPAIALLRWDGAFSGIQFHGVPGGHEFTSFVLALYNVSGPGQTTEEAVDKRIKALKGRNIKVGVSLTCTMCPDVMAAAGLIAARNESIQAEMVDIAHFPEFGKSHGIMSVPAIVLDDEKVLFGKKSLEQMVEILEAE